MLYPKTGGEWTAYRPPKRAKFGHQARTRDPELAWTATKAFLAAHCASTLQESVVQLSCWPPGLLTSPSASEAGLEAAGQFGGPDREQRGVRIWDLPAERIDEAMRCCSINRAWSESIGPLTIHFTYRIAWRALTTVTDLGSVGPSEGLSLLGVGIWTRSLFLQPVFVFPLAWDSGALRAFLADLEKSCPFRFRDAYFQRWVRSPTGRPTRTRRLSRGWREGSGR